MQEELVSVIIPVYNIEDYLPRCLACIEMQSYRNLEIILVDDGSIDGSGIICDEFAAKDFRARVIHHTENKGLWAARNTGQDAAMGEYLWFPDGDDYFHKDIVKVMHEAINMTNASGEKYDVAFVGYKRTSRFDEDVLTERTPSYVEKTLEEVLELFVIPTGNLTCRHIWNKLCRKVFVNDIRTGNYKYAQDCDFNLKVYRKSPKSIYITNIMYYFVDRASSARCKPDFKIDSTKCVVRLLYDNFRCKKVKNTCCDRHILSYLYVMMAKWLDLTQGMDSLTSARKECKEIVCHTWIHYINCKTVKTLSRRFGRVLRIRFDQLYRLWI